LINITQKIFGMNSKPVKVAHTNLFLSMFGNFDHHLATFLDPKSTTRLSRVSKSMHQHFGPIAFRNNTHDLILASMTYASWQRAMLCSGVLAWNDSRFAVPEFDVALFPNLQRLAFSELYFFETVDISDCVQLRQLHLPRLTGIMEGRLPCGLTHLWLEDCLSFELGALPATLVHITFGYHFNVPLGEVFLPPNLVSLVLGAKFNQVLDVDDFPESLQELTFGVYYNQPIPKEVLPQNLQKLTFRRGFDQSIGEGILPPNLKELHLDTTIRRREKPIFIPASLERIVVRVRHYPQMCGPVAFHNREIDVSHLDAGYFQWWNN
jgi:hypothetical protein